MNNFSELKKRVLSNRVNYEKLKKSCLLIQNNKIKKPFINVIVPVKNRLEFAEPLYERFIKSKKWLDKSVILTIVENDEFPKHKKFFSDKDVNYIFVKCDDGDLFNKCLSNNIGALFSVGSKYFVFHDLDILFDDYFFRDLDENIEAQAAKALQCYTNKRVLHCNAKLTEKILEHKSSINNLDDKSKGIYLPGYGSKGGSLLIEKKLFFEVGGYDPEIFAGYSHEDAFFWEKISTKANICFSDHPAIELFHLKHEAQINNNPYFKLMEETYELFLSLDKKEKMNFIKMKKEFLK